MVSPRAMAVPAVNVLRAVTAHRVNVLRAVTAHRVNVLPAVTAHRTATIGAVVPTVPGDGRAEVPRRPGDPSEAGVTAPRVSGPVRPHVGARNDRDANVPVVPRWSPPIAMPLWRR